MNTTPDYDIEKLIVSKGWDQNYILVDAETGAPIIRGEIVKGGKAPHKPSSQGKIWPIDGGEYYASTKGMKWKGIKEGYNL